MIIKSFDLKGSSYWNSWHTIYIKYDVPISYLMKGATDVSFRLMLSY